MIRWLRDLLCKRGHHKRLWYIQKFGAASHVGCPDCLREIAMHDGLRVAVPWNNEFEQLHKGCGYDVEKFRQLFRERARCQTSS